MKWNRNVLIYKMVFVAKMNRLKVTNIHNIRNGETIIIYI